MTGTTKILAAVLAAAVATGAQADTITVNLDTPLVSDNNFTSVDINQDGATDLMLYAQTVGSVGADTGVVLGQSNGVGNTVFDNLFTDEPTDVGVYTIGRVLADFNGELIGLGADTRVDDSTANSFEGRWTSASSLAYDNMTGLLPAGGAKAYIGVRLDVYDYLADDNCNGCVLLPDVEAEFRGHIYGWLELERGSLITSMFGYGSDLNLAAVTPTAPDMNVVPLPAGLPLLLAGLGAFGLVGRRRAKA